MEIVNAKKFQHPFGTRRLCVVNRIAVLIKLVVVVNSSSHLTHRLDRLPLLIGPMNHHTQPHAKHRQQHEKRPQAVLPEAAAGFRLGAFGGHARILLHRTSNAD